MADIDADARELLEVAYSMFNTWQVLLSAASVNARLGLDMLGASEQDPARHRTLSELRSRMDVLAEELHRATGGISWH